MAFRRSAVRLRSAPLFPQGRSWRADVWNKQMTGSLSAIRLAVCVLAVICLVFHAACGGRQVVAPPRAPVAERSETFASLEEAQPSAVREESREPSKWEEAATAVLFVVVVLGGALGSILLLL